MIPALLVAVCACLLGLAALVAVQARRSRRDRAAMEATIAEVTAQTAAVEAQLEEQQRELTELTELTEASEPADSRGIERVAQTSPEFVITRVGETSTAEGSAHLPARRVDGPLFVDLVVRESTVRIASLASGMRRALSPEVRNRIRFAMRQEVKRARKERRRELRLARQELIARQRDAA